MKRLLNTLYVTSGNKYLSLDGENVVVLEDQKEIGRIPLHNLQAIITFGYTGASPALMGVCAQRNIDLSFMSGNGRFAEFERYPIYKKNYIHAFERMLKRRSECGNKIVPGWDSGTDVFNWWMEDKNIKGQEELIIDSNGNIKY